MSKRSPQTQSLYDQAKRDGTSIVELGDDGEVFFNLSRAVILQEFTHWVIVANDFPYDMIFSEHNMLVPKRSFNFIREATEEERDEYYSIKKQLDEEGGYHSIIENFSGTRSAPGHFHAHLVVWKDK